MIIQSEVRKEINETLERVSSMIPIDLRLGENRNGTAVYRKLNMGENDDLSS